MDGTTEPIIAIIGHPIAGNPSQLAIERALEALQLEWRVLSFDVTPENVGKALEGFSVTGVSGVMIDPSSQAAASQWYRGHADAIAMVEADLAGKSVAVDGEASDADSSDSAELAWIDCLHRGTDGIFVGSYQRRRWIENQLTNSSVDKAIWLGKIPEPDQRNRLPIDWSSIQWTIMDEKQIDGAAVDADSLASTSLIVLSETASEEQDDGHLDSEIMDGDQWPENDGSTLILDLTDGHFVCHAALSRGYNVKTCLDLRVGTLQRCIEEWTGKQASKETIADAMEEYHGV